MDDPGKNLDWDFAVTSFRAMADRRIIRTPGRAQRACNAAHHYFVATSGRNSTSKRRLHKARDARTLDALEKSFPGVASPCIEDDPQSAATHSPSKAITGARERKEPSTPPLPAAQARTRPVSPDGWFRLKILWCARAP
jgi:hypothetical protein